MLMTKSSTILVLLALASRVVKSDPWISEDGFLEVERILKEKKNAKSLENEAIANFAKIFVAESLGLSQPPRPCQELDLRNPPKFSNCEDLGRTLNDLFSLMNYKACELGPTSNFGLEVFGNALLELAGECAFSRFRESNEKDNKENKDKDDEQRWIPNVEVEETEQLFCTQRFDDASYNNLVPVPNDLVNLTGTTNKYGWGANFNDECGVGVVIHSAGTPGLINPGYSLPTITLRNVDGDVIFEGVYADTFESNGIAPPQTGLRSAQIVKCDGDVITVIATSVSKPEGAFLRFDLDLSSYTGTPIRGLLPQFPFVNAPSPSVRSTYKLSDSLILYAPNYDLGGNFAFPSLRLYDWTIPAELNLDFPLVDENGIPIAGLIWDFECEPTGMCWINLIEFNPERKERGLPEPKLFYFPLWVFDGALEEGFPIQLSEVPTAFDIEYAAMSLEPLTADTSVACTLSGFVYAFLKSNSTVSTDANPREQSLLRELGLGIPQQCNICQANMILGNAESQENARCMPVGINGIQSTSAYVWQVKECGDSVFAGVFDLSGVVAGEVWGALMERVVENACLSPETMDFVCTRNECSGVASDDMPICESAVSGAFDGFLRTFSGVQSMLSAYLISSIYGEEITPADFGFDLFYIKKKDIFKEGAEFELVTKNGFRDLTASPPNFLGVDNSWLFPYNFDPSAPLDDGIRNMVCHTDPKSKKSKLVVATAAFDFAESSATYVLDLNKKECK